MEGFRILVDEEWASAEQEYIEKELRAAGSANPKSIADNFTCFACTEAFDLAAKAPVQCTTCWFTICATCASDAMQTGKCLQCDDQSRIGGNRLSFVPNQGLIILLEKEKQVNDRLSAEKEAAEKKIRDRIARIAHLIAISLRQAPIPAWNPSAKLTKDGSYDIRYEFAVEEFEKIANAKSGVNPFAYLREAQEAMDRIPVPSEDNHEEEALDSHLEYEIWNKLIWPRAGTQGGKGDWRIVRARDAYNLMIEGQSLPKECKRDDVTSAPERSLWCSNQGYLWTEDVQWL